MIVYRCATCPPWLAGAPDLQRRDLHGGVALWAIGDPLLVQPADTWQEVEKVGENTCEAGTVGDRSTECLARHMPGWHMETAHDAASGEWSVPVILNRSGERNFPCPFGPDYLPRPTHKQERLLHIGKAIRCELIRAGSAKDGEEMSIDAAISARWAAEIIVFANHISEMTLLSLGYLDEILIVDALTKAVCHGES